MAYDRNDPRHGPRDERSRWSEDRYEGRERGGRDERGFFERAGDQISSWFGDDDDRPRGERDPDRERGWDRGRDRFSPVDERHPRDERAQRREYWGGGGERSRERDDYRPMTGDYSRSEGMFAASGYGRGMDEQRGRDDHRRSRFAGSADRSQPADPHYHEWRQRQISALDRDYDEYRREHQSKFESDFGEWRNQRQTKRQMLGQIREHFEVVGSDEQHVGKVDRVAGDRIILAKSDPDSGGAHHSLSCSELDRVEGDRVILNCSAEQAMRRWRDESRDRALFEREDQGESGPHMLDRSFSGTYR